MENKVELERVEQLVAQLSPQEQLRVVARVSQRLSEQMSSRPLEASGDDSYTHRVEAFLKMSDAGAAQTLKAVDSAQDIRQIRQARTSRL